MPAERWRDFATRHGINRQWYRQIDKSSDYTSRYEWVCLRPIEAKEWLEIRDMCTGLPLAEKDIPDPEDAALARLGEAREVFDRYHQYLEANGGQDWNFGEAILPSAS